MPLKFTQTGKISIESKTLIENKNKFLFISVIDTGIGIKPNEIQLIFKEFKQLSEGTLKRFPRNWSWTVYFKTIYRTLKWGTIS